MDIYFLMIDKLLKVLSYSFNIVTYFFYVEICSKMLLRGVGFIEFNKIGVIKIADFFKTCLKNIFLYVFIDFVKRLQFIDYFLANVASAQMIELFYQ